MSKHNQDGAINVLLVPLIVAVLFFVGTLAFGYWAFGERQKYKNDSDQIVAQAVEQAKQQNSAEKDKQFAEASKNPLKTFSGPSQYGSIKAQYPKTWSAYVSTTGDGLNGYFQPDTVPSVDDQNNSFALRIQVVNQAYSDVSKTFDGQEGVTISPYALPKVPKVVGLRVTGQIEEQKQGDMIILPLRTTTLEIFTESDAYKADFNNIILPNFTFSP